MNWNTWGRWGTAMLVVGCGSKLQVDNVSPPSSGAGAGNLEPTNFGGGGGGGQVTPDPGAGVLGKACLPAGTVTEATGSVAQTDIIELARCSDGSACGPDGLCIAVPDCPQPSGVCVVRQLLAGAGGSGGAGSSPPKGSYAGGSGEIDKAGVQGLAADDSNLYWVEYGTRDSLGNYQNDGALFSQALSGGTATQITSGLSGPVGLGLTSSHAYVFVDGGALVGSDTHPQLVRVPLAGGAIEAVQDGLSGSFASVGDVAFWASQDNVYEQTPEPASTPTVFLADWINALTTDGRDLFYLHTTIWRAPLDGSAPQALALNIWPFQPSGDFIYGLESTDNGTGMVLDRAPMTGNTFQRARALGAGGFVGGFQIIGDRFFFASATDSTRLNITTGSLSSSDPPVRLVEAAVPSSIQPLLWVATADTLYWSDGRAIYARPVASAP
jgi:hypothetical protein